MMGQELSRLIRDDGAYASAAAPLHIIGLTADSREVAPGFLFAALPGTKVDGTAYLAAAKDKGAIAAIVPEGTADVPGLALVRTDNPRRLLALAAARFYDDQPDTIVAVTGTNGKTSVTVFVRQIWAEMGFRAASLGTIGIVGPDGAVELKHTTPDPVKLQEAVAALADQRVEHLAIEASSHGLVQHRLDGLHISAAAFTNFTRDHLDYHHSLEDYFDAKMMLFEKLLCPGSPAVINADMPEAADIIRRCKAHGLVPYTVGEKGDTIRILKTLQTENGQFLTLRMADGTFDVPLPLVGDFQASNAVVAAGLVLATGGEAAQVRHALASLKGASGRLERVGSKPNGARVFVDYAHTPDAIETALKALRPSTRGRLDVVFGCGGDRDKGKRPLMAKAAAQNADRVYITDDNPRTEDASTIRREALAGAPQAIEIGNRAEAIARAMAKLEPGDVLLVAGKGHEPGQTIGTIVHPFSDHDAVKAALDGKTYDPK
jgi:UDP-N-acetylmuramoyl-L-alanyl-D-glutamate--2,6-diaminopimelate ligase